MVLNMTKYTESLISFHKTIVFPFCFFCSKSFFLNWFCGAPILPNYNKNYRIKDESVEYGFPIPKPSGNESDNLELSSSVKIIGIVFEIFWNLQAIFLRESRFLVGFSLIYNVFIAIIKLVFVAITVSRLYS